MNKVKTHINFDNFGKGKFKYLPPDAYVIQHPFILSNFKLLQINKSYIFITSGVYDPVIQAVRLLKVWDEKNVVWLEVMNLETCKVEVHAQNLESDESNILIISMLFPDKCVKLANKKGGKVVDPNFLADISARYGEIAPIPKFAHDFIEKYQDRIVYGTDMSFGERTYKITFRILETADENSYEIDKFNYHWPLYGLALSNKTLKKLYRDNAIKIINR